MFLFPPFKPQDSTTWVLVDAPLGTYIQATVCKEINVNLTAFLLQDLQMTFRDARAQNQTYTQVENVWVTG